MKRNSFNHNVKFTGKSIFVIVAFVFVLFFGTAKAQNLTFPAGSIIIDMGVVPQTVGNALKPYGLIYHLIKEHAVPVSWIINNKIKDGIDFTYNGYDFKGGPFVISAPYLIPDVLTEIAKPEWAGVVVVTTTSPITVPVFKQLVVSAIPRWTLDKQNGAIAQPFFVNAGIPPQAYGGPTSATWKTPAQLAGCDDIFVMPHADPTWATHQNLLTWNAVHKGSIWLGCHAGSALEDMFNPTNPSEQTNFLSEKTVVATGAGPYYENALVLWGNHSGGTPPYTYEYGEDPVMQFMGPIDAATLNGSEQIYIPKAAGWRPTTFVSCYDPDHPQILSADRKHRASVIAYGPGFGNIDNGWVMIEAGHNIGKGTLPANIAAQRAFFNFSFLAAKTKDPDPDINITLGTITSGSTVPLSFTVSAPYTINDFDILWSSSCGGVFSAPASATTDFTSPQVNAPTDCIITVTLTQKGECGRVFKSSTSALIICALTLTSNVSPACFGSTNGSINITNIVGGVPNYNWSWTKSGGGSGSGSSAVVPFSITGLAPGDYSVTILALNGTGCGASFTTAINQNSAITVTTAAINLSCNGSANGAIDVSVSGGSPGYNFDWEDIAGTTNLQNRNNLTAGTYNLTVTDSKVCAAIASAIVIQPDAITVTPVITNINCYGESGGAVTLTIAGGISPYSYLWNDGNANKDRTGLLAGAYSVTVTDASGCKQTLNPINVTQPAAVLALSEAHTDILCNGASTGSIDLTVTGGTVPYTYTWVGEGGYTNNTQDIGSLSAGAYNVTVTDANGCQSKLSLTLTQPPALVLGTTVTNATCPPGAQTNGADGKIDLSVNGGSGSYTSFSWTGPGGFTANTQNISNLIAGTYTVVVTDSNGCTKTTSATLIYLNPNPLAPGSINH